MGELSRIKKCIDLTDADVAAAVESRDGTRALLVHLAKISSPGTGAAKSLLVFARMSTTACDWLDGDLRVEIVGDGDASAVEVLLDLGMGMRERVFPPLAFATPLEEFVRAVERVPHMIAPLAVTSKTSRRLVLGATAEVRKSSLPPAPVKISEESFFVPRAPSPVKEIARGAPSLPVVTPAKKRPPPPPAPKPKPKTKSKRPSRAPAPEKKEKSVPGDDVDKGWDDE